jgi:membrane protein implicated in regulation of membrane protease activity
MEWWLWVILGFLMMVAELLTPGGFYLLFFGVGGVIVGSLDALGWAGPAWTQWLLFSLLSVVSLVVFRRPLLARFKSAAPGKEMDSLIGETAQALEEIAVDSIGKVELRGTTWTARNAGGRSLGRGQRCRVDRVDGLILWVRGL